MTRRRLLIATASLFAAAAVATGIKPAPGGGGIGVASITAGLNIDGATIGGLTPMVATVGTGFTQQDLTAATTAPLSVYRKRRATAGVAANDYLGAETYQGWDGAAYTQGIQTGAFVSPGATVGAGAVPSTWFVTATPTANPVGANETLGLRLFSSGVTGANFPANTADADLILAHSVHLDNAAFSAWGPASGAGSFAAAMAQFRPNSAGALQETGHLAWEYSDNTAGNETSGFDIDARSGGNLIDLCNVKSFAGNLVTWGFGQGNATRPALSFGPLSIVGPVAGVNPTSTGFYQANSNADVSLSIAGVQMYTAFQAAAAVSGNAQTAAGDFEIHVNGGPSFGTESRVTVGPPGNHSGMYYDHMQGGVYLTATSAPVSFGSPNHVYANNTIEGFVGLPQMAGAPTGNPSTNGTLAKTFVNWDTTNHGLWAWRTGTTFDWMPTATSTAAGSQTLTITNGPAGITSTTPKWETFKDAAGVTSYRPYWQ